METARSSAYVNVGSRVLPCTVLYNDAQNASVVSGERTIISQGY